MRSAASMVAIALFVVCANAAILFNGNFNDYTVNTDLDKWSFGNEGTWPYRTYIYGNRDPANKMSTFVGLSSSYQNTIDASAKQGVRVELNGNSYWNSPPMLRTELVARLPTTASSGTTYYQFSILQGTTAQLNPAYEHQIMFLESHAADLKFGGQYGNKLNFLNNAGQNLWSAEFGTNVWHNFAIQMNFATNQIALYHSTGTAALAQVVAPTTTGGLSNPEWHIGMLRLAKDGAQDPTPTALYISSVYVADSLMTFSATANGAPASGIGGAGAGGAGAGGAGAGAGGAGAGAGGAGAGAGAGGAGAGTGDVSGTGSGTGGSSPDNQQAAESKSKSGSNNSGMSAGVAGAIAFLVILVVALVVIIVAYTVRGEIFGMTYDEQSKKFVSAASYKYSHSGPSSAGAEKFSRA